MRKLAISITESCRRDVLDQSRKSLLSKAVQINLQKSHRSRTEHINLPRMIDKAYIEWGGEIKGNQRYEWG